MKMYKTVDRHSAKFPIMNKYLEMTYMYSLQLKLMILNCCALLSDLQAVDWCWPIANRINVIGNWQHI